MAELRSVRLDELDADGVVVELSDAEARELSASLLVEVRPERGGGWRLLPNGGRVGAVRVGDGLQVEVRPKEKVGIRHLLFLLGYARDPGFRDDDVVADADDELWPALAHSLTQSVGRALSRGVLQGYRSAEESLTTIRGRIRFDDQIRARPGLLMPIEVTYDDFTVDTAENRLLRAALRTMLAVPRLDDAVRRELLHLDLRLEGVAVLPRGAQIPPWVPSRLNQRYQPALRLAEIVLRNCSARPASRDGVDVAAFVVVMWTVFEDFVTVALTEALRSRPGHTRAQLPAYLAGAGDWRGGQIAMNVDIVHLDTSGRPAVVFDAKYKVASPTGRYANADLYQMLAYCTALDVSRAWLVYAGGGPHDTVRRIKNSSVEVNEVPLDLSASPAVLLAWIDEIAERAVSAANRSLTSA